MRLQHLMESELIVLKTSDKSSARKSSLKFAWLLFTAADIVFGVGGDKQIFLIETLSGGKGSLRGDSLCPLPLRRKKKPGYFAVRQTIRVDPPHCSQIFLIFLGVCLTLDYDYMCSETYVTQERSPFHPIT